MPMPSAWRPGPSAHDYHYGLENLRAALEADARAGISIRAGLP